MSLIILTTLGAADNSEATYQWGERTPVQTKLVSAALSQWFPEAEVKVLLTPFADEKNGNLLRELLPYSQTLPIENGETEADNWQLFSVIAEAIPEGAEVIFDITHGFRSLPVITLLALSYLRVVKKVQLRSVVYGAWERGRPATVVTPIFDLTPFVTLLDWAQASNQFLRTGDARSMTELMQGPEMQSLAALREPLENVSASLAFQRPIQTAQNAQRLRQEIERVNTTQLKHPVVSLVLEHIEDRFEGVAHDDHAFASRHDQALKGQYAQMKFYVRGGQYAQAVELAYEWFRSIQMWKLRDPQNLELWLNDKRTSPRAMGNIDFEPQEDWKDFLGLQKRVRDLRHSFAHFNEYKSEFGEELANPNTLTREIENIVMNLIPAAVRPLGLELEPPKMERP